MKLASQKKVKTNLQTARVLRVALCVVASSFGRARRHPFLLITLPILFPTLCLSIPMLVPLLPF